MKKYNFANVNEWADHIEDVANEYLDCNECYKTREDRKGLRTNVINSIEAKKYLREMFEKHPCYNGNGQIILPSEVERSFDYDVVLDFKKFINVKSQEIFFKEEVTIDGMTYDQVQIELKKKRNIVNSIRNIAGVEMRDIKYKDVSFETIAYEEIPALERMIYEFSSRSMRVWDEFEKKEKRVTNKSASTVNRISKIMNLITRERCRKYVEDRNVIDEIKSMYPDFKGRTGQKLSSVILKAIKITGLYDKLMENDDDKKEFNKKFAEFCDAVNPLKIKRWFVISVNFVDYLTMSNGDGWTSCINTNPGRLNGMFNGGFNGRRTLDYSLDQSTIVVYTIDEKTDINSDVKIELLPKITRQLFHWGEGKLIQSRLYPQVRTVREEIYAYYRTIVEKVIADCLGEANLWSAPTYGRIYNNGNVVKTPYYNDNSSSYIDFLSTACHGDGADSTEYFIGQVNYTVFKGDDGNEDNGLPMEIGSIDAVCIFDGEQMRQGFSNRIFKDGFDYFSVNSVPGDVEYDYY